MKTIGLSVIAAFAVLLAITAFGQTDGTTAVPTQGDAPGNATSTRSSLGIWQRVPQDFGSTEWQRVQLATNAESGQLEYRTNQYTEIANNLNFINETGVLEASVDAIRLMTNTGGAAALKGPTKVYFPPTLGGPNDDPLTIVTVSNTVLKIRPLGLYYFDAQSGKSVLLASAQQAQGELVGVNQVVYRSILNGLTSDLRITYTKGACESDLIMLARPKPPEAFGLNSAFTRMELWHAIDGPVPRQTPITLDTITDPALRATMIEPDFIDETLDFEDLHFPQGRAFSWSGDDQSSLSVPAPVQTPSGNAGPTSVPVAKRWGAIGQQPALCESVQWTDIEPYIASLPLMAQAERSGRTLRASLKRELPTLTRQVGLKHPAMKLALSPYKAKGFVWDYVTVSGGYSSYTFSAGTYFISGLVSISGTATFNSGCYLKYASGAYVLCSGSVVCNGNGASPSVFTSMNDNAFGDPIANSTGYPTYCASPAVWMYYMPSAQTLSGLKIRWAVTGIRDDANSFVNTVASTSLEWCQTGIYVNNVQIALQNSTQCSLGTALNGNGGWSYTGSLANICNGTDPFNNFSYSWEYEYFGYTGVAPGVDQDGDGLSNQQEYSSGTNPQVSDRPTIQPQNPLVARGGNVTFIASVAQTQPPSYQWTFNGANIAGATTSTYSISGVQLGNAGYYAVTANFSGGSSSSSSTFLSIATPTSGIPEPPNVISWWPAEGNANDIAGTNNGQWSGTAAYSSGEVGQAFSLNGTINFIEVPSSGSLQLSNQFTLELWYKDTGSSGWYGLLAKRSNTGLQYCNFGINANPGGNFMQVYFLDPTTQPGYQVSTISPLSSVNVFHHLAATYQQVDSSHIQIATYIDGTLKTNNTFSGNLAGTFDNSPVTIGASYPGGEVFKGLIDEVSIYSRALTANEIQGIYNIGSSGKYLPPAPPTITSQPQSLVVSPGANATFSVGASGATPYSYQWTFNGAAISGATTSSYTVANAQSVNVGTYAVVVANSGGSVLSANATLGLLGPCDTAPSGLVSWWCGEGNAVDIMSANDGAFSGTYSTAEVGQGFAFGGSAPCVQVQSSPSIQLSNQFTLEFWYKDTGSSGWYGLIAKRATTGSQPCNFGINVNVGGNYMQVYFLDPTTQPGYQVSTVSPLPSINAFHHLAATYQQVDSSHIQIQTYFDGTLKKTDTFSGNLAGTFDNSPVTIGASYPTGEFFKGVIDEATIYSRVLSSTEIQGIYNAGNAGKCGYNVPVGWYSLHGLNPQTLGIANQDADLDGFLNFQEYLFGTDPQVSQGVGIWVATPNGLSAIP